MYNQNAEAAIRPIPVEFLNKLFSMFDRVETDMFNMIESQFGLPMDLVKLIHSYIGNTHFLSVFSCFYFPSRCFLV